MPDIGSPRLPHFHPFRMYATSKISWWSDPYERVRSEQARGIGDHRDSEANEVRLLEFADPSRIDWEAGFDFHPDLWIEGIHRNGSLVLMLGISVSHYGLEHTV
jgi:hypothetical protein